MVNNNRGSENLRKKSNEKTLNNIDRKQMKKQLRSDYLERPRRSVDDTKNNRGMKT